MDLVYITLINQICSQTSEDLFWGHSGNFHFGILVLFQSVNLTKGNEMNMPTVGISTNVY